MNEEEENEEDHSALADATRRFTTEFLVVLGTSTSTRGLEALAS